MVTACPQLILQQAVHVIDNLLVLLLQLRPLELEGRGQQVVLDGKNIGLEMQRLDELKALQLLGPPGRHQILKGEHDSVKP